MRIFLLTAAVLAVFSLPAQAQRGWCAERSVIAETLEQKYSEVLLTVGVSGNGHLIQVYSSPDTTFTILEVWPNGMACLVGVGEGWRDVPQPKPGKPL